MIKDKIITSEAANLLMSYILPDYDNDEYMLHIFEAIGKEMDELIAWVQDFENQPYPQFATFTLPYWEEGIGLEVDEKMSVAQRRKRIITKLSTYFPITRQKLESIASSAAGAPITINDFVSDYTFRVNIGAAETIDLQGLIEEINDTKPAHLSYLLNQMLFGGFKVGSASFYGEQITVYPWSQTKELETVGIEHVAAGYQSLENITVYPGGA